MAARKLRKFIFFTDKFNRKRVECKEADLFKGAPQRVKEFFRQMIHNMKEKKV